MISKRCANDGATPTNGANTGIWRAMVGAWFDSSRRGTMRRTGAERDCALDARRLGAAGGAEFTRGDYSQSPER